MSGVSRVSIPSSVRKTIQNIKEIAGNHSDEEIYAMLRECSMDPNETTQKLLFQDTFHEVKRKRDKRKEINRETTDIKWRPGPQGRGGRAGRGNYSSRYASHDASAGRNISAGKEDGIGQIRDKDITSSSHTALDTGYKAGSAEKKSSIYMPKSIGNRPNGSIKEERLLADDPSFSGGPSVVEEITVEIKSGISSVQEKFLSSSTGQETSSIAVASSAGVYSSASDTLVVPSHVGHIPVSVDTIKHGLGIQRSAGKTNANRIISHGVGVSEASFLKKIGADEKNNSSVNGKVQGSSSELEGTLVLDTFQSAPSTAIAGTSGSRPSSNYSNRSQHASGLLKAGAKEWKPKSTNVNPAPSSEVCSTSGVDLNKGEAVTCMLHASDSIASDISKNELKLEDLHISETQHVIIPDHLQVPESERTGLSFGSFGSNFILEMRSKGELEDIKCPEEPSELSIELEENVDQLPSCASDESQVAQENTSDDQQAEMLENHSSSVSEIPSNMPLASEYDQPKAAVSLATEVSQRSVIHTAPVYSNFGLVPQMLGSPFATLEGGDMQARDTSRLPGFVVQQPFDPSSNYYATIYRPSADGDGRFSPFLAPGATPKYNGNISVLTAQSGQSPEESSNSLVLSSTGPTPLVTQGAGVLQNSVAASHQPVPVFRQPAGVHISHYPPNYGPYSQYFSPFYVPPPTAIHHFLGNAAMYPQQAPTGSLYPTPTATAGTTTVKYPISQYKPATNSGPTSQGPYGMNPAGYNSSVSGGNSTGNEDLSSSQFKENYVFINGQQSEGSAVWFSPPGRDISTLQSGSFYNIPPHGQPVAFAPTQAGHAAAFSGVYHPTQSVAAGSVHPLLQQSQAVGGASEIAGPFAGVYQQPQRSSQINWINNF